MGPIVLFTDFGLSGPWIGQVKTAIWRENPAMPVFDLMHDVPVGDIRSGAYLLAALSQWYDKDSVFMAVVDPGVGSDRPVLVLEADGRWFIGPDNGLFEIVARRAAQAQFWQPEHLPLLESASATFHGRDVFAPLAARLANSIALQIERLPGPTVRKEEWPDSLPQVIYFDHFGNACTGLFAGDFPVDVRVTIGDMTIPRCRTYSDVPVGAPLLYENSNGLLEIAVNQGRADQLPGLTRGTKIAF